MLGPGGTVKAADHHKKKKIQRLKGNKPKFTKILSLEVIRERQRDEETP